MEDDSKLGYFFIGIGVGVAVGLLFAPKSGEQTRQLLRDRAVDSGDYLKRQTTDLKSTATDLLDKGKDTLAKHKETLTSAVEAGKQAYREAVTAVD